MKKDSDKQQVIELIDGYVLIVDRLSWSLARETGKNKKGDPVYKYFGHFGSVEKALKQLGRELVYDSLKNDCSTFVTLCTRIVESNNRLENFIRESFPEYEVVKKGE